MAVTQNSYTGNNSTTTYSFTFPYLKQTEIKASLDGVATTNFSIPTATTIQFHNGATPPVATAPGNGVKIRIFRETDTDSLAATFYAGSAIKSQDLNDNFTQNLYATQEAGSRYVDKFGGSIMTGDLLIGEDAVVKFEGATDNEHEITLTVADPSADSTITLPNTTGTVVTTGDIGTVVNGMIAADAITGAKIDDDQINSEHYAAASIDTEHIADSQITTSKIANDAVTADKIDDDAITNAKINTDASIDLSKLEVITSNRIVGNDSGNAVPKELSPTEVRTIINVEDGATADQTAAEIKTLLDASQLGNDQLASNCIATANIQNGNVTNAKIATDAISTDRIIDANITTDKIADDAVTSDKLADAELTTLAGMQSGTASNLASSTALTATNLEINTICDGKAVETTISDTDSAYPTSGAVVDYVTAQIAPIGGLEVIATDAVFPDTQPQAGVVISIADAGGLVVNGSGTSTTGRTVGGSTVTINNIASNFNSSTVDAGVAMMVSSTGSDQIYNYHKATLKEADLLSLSNDINDFANRYRVASSAPSSNNDEGDLWYNTSGNKLQVYNSSTSSWADVTTVGDFNINTISSSGNTGGGSATFNGTAYRFVLSNPPTSAQQLIVSINGVIQKPNSGTSQPSEGFAISGADIILSAAPATGSDYFIITQGSAVSVGTPSDNTVSTAKIQNLAITGDKIATNLDLVDNKKIRFGTNPSNDFEIYHNGDTYLKNNSEGGTLYLQTYGENAVKCVPNAGVELYYDGSGPKFETTSEGALVSGALGINGQNLTHAANTLKIGHEGSGVHQLRAYGPDGSNNGKIQFNSSRSDGTTPKTITYSAGDLEFPDTQKIKMGDLEDLQIYHDGVSTNHSYITHTPTDGHLWIESGANIAFNVKTDEKALDLNSNGSVALYYDGGTYSTAKFETTATGAKVTGKLFIDTAEKFDPYASTRAYIKGDLALGRDKAAVDADEPLSAISFYSNDDNLTTTINSEVQNYSLIARIRAESDGAFTADNSPTRLVFHTYKANTATNNSPHEALRLDSNQNATFAGDVNILKAGRTNLSIGSSDASGAVIFLDGDSDGDVSGSDYAFIEHTSSGDLCFYGDNPNSDSELKFYTSDAATLALTLTGANATFAGTVSDSEGDLRDRSVTATAEGAIAADKPVILKSDGKVSQVTDEGTDTITGSSNYYDQNGGAIEPVSVFDPDSGKTVIFFADTSGTDPQICYKVATVASDNTISYGTKRVARDDEDIVVSSKTIRAIYSTVHNKFILSWLEEAGGGVAGNYLRIMVGTMDAGNDSISWGSVVPSLDQGNDYRSVIDYAIAADDDNGTVLVAFRTDHPSNNSYDNTRLAGFVTNSSDNTTNSGVVDDVVLTVHSGDNEDYIPKTIAYDPDNNKYVALFEYGHNTFIKHISVDSSDGGVTQGTLQTLANDVNDAGLAYDPAGDYFVVGFRYKNSSHANYNQIAALPFTFDGSDFSIGTMYIPTTGITSTQGIAADPMFFNPDTKEFIYTYTYNDLPQIVRFRRKYYPYSSDIQFASRPILSLSLIHI